MWELQKQDLPYERKLVPKEEGLEEVRKWRVDEVRTHRRARRRRLFSEYTLGPQFIDFCRGPHVPSTKRHQGFQAAVHRRRLLEGRREEPRLQRIYGTAFFSPKELEQYLKQLEEAKKRDHRKLGKELDLFSIQELPGPGLIFFHPKGGTIRKQIEDWMRDSTSSAATRWSTRRTSPAPTSGRPRGTTTFYAENMFKRMELDDAEYQLKPMNCPFHILIYADKLRSYRDLPGALGELGTVYRYERSGVMHGLLRVRGFTQDDAHIFCTPEQIEDEVVSCLEFAIDTLTTFGFERVQAELSTWDGGASGKYDGTPSSGRWPRRAPQGRSRTPRHEAKVMPDEAAFYGPKIDVKLVDAIGRPWQLSTVQFDFTLPRRFELEYIAEDGKAHQPLMVHRALYGSRRALLRHSGRALRRRVSRVAGAGAGDRAAHHRRPQNDYAREVRARLRAAGIRADPGRPQREGEPEDPRGAVAEDPLHAGGRRTARRRTGRFRCATASTATGAEDELGENLGSFFEQDHPRYELLFAVRSAEDPAVAVVEKLRTAYPAVPSRLIVTGEPPYPNAKVFSLDRMIAAARHELLVMSDSDIRVGPDFLRIVESEFSDPGVGLATCPYRAVPGPSIWSRMEAIGMNTHFLAGVLVARMLEGMRFALGPTIVARRQVLESLGGIGRFQEYLAEDFVLGQQAADSGAGVILSAAVIEHHIGGHAFRRNLAHRLRWNRSTRRSRPWGYLGQIFTNPLPVALLVWAAEPAWWPVIPATAAFRLLAGWAAAGLVLRDSLTVRRWFLVPLEDLWSFLLWLAAFFGNTIEWRGRRYELLKDGRFRLLPRS
jgi:threonyl-tRNA synthetase